MHDMSTHTDRSLRRIAADAIANGEADFFVSAIIDLIDPAKVIAANDALPKFERKNMLPWPHTDALLKEDLRVGMYVRLTGWHHDEIGLIVALGPEKFSLRLSAYSRPYRLSFSHCNPDGSGTYVEDRYYSDTGAASYGDDGDRWNQANRLVPA